MSRTGSCIIEPLESRHLFNAAMGPIIASSIQSPQVALKLAPVGMGVTLQLQAGVAFTGEVAFIPSPASGLGPSAQIIWGDGASSTATLQVTTQAGITGYDVIGTHAYADPGTYSIVTNMLLTPIPIPGQPTPEFLMVAPPVISTAIVAPSSIAQPSTGTPLIIHEVAGVRFDVDLGSFTTIAPGTHLRANIHWSDGKTSAGTLTAAGVVGLDEITFEVTGTHKYNHAGTYSITVNVVRLPVGASLAIARIATFDATAIVSARPPR